MKKLLSILFLATVLTVPAQADLVTYVIPRSQTVGGTSGNPVSKYLTIPAGKICKILTFASYSSANVPQIWAVDDQNNELVWILAGTQNSPAVKEPKTDPVVVAGPIKLQINIYESSSMLLTVEITDQTTPASNLSLTDS